MTHFHDRLEPKLSNDRSSEHVGEIQSLAQRESRRATQGGGIRCLVVN